MCTANANLFPSTQYNDKQNSIGSQFCLFLFSKQLMQEIIHISTSNREGLYDITHQIETFVKRSGINEGIINVYAQGATAAIMIQENWDDSVQTDVVNLLQKLIPRGVWLHDRQDGNGDSHLKAGIVGPSESIPIINGKLGLSTWQNIFFCEFDGPRAERRVILTLVSHQC
jgi:secondary thiamine-phosphate synthase enzyme